MKALFYSSLILPVVYVVSILLFVAGLLFGFDIAELIRPYNDVVIGVIAGLTFSYVAVCFPILWRLKQARRTKIEWSAVLVLLNIIGVPWFLWCYNHDSLRRALCPNEKRL